MGPGAGPAAAAVRCAAVAPAQASSFQSKQAGLLAALVLYFYFCAAHASLRQFSAALAVLSPVALYVYKAKAKGPRAPGAKHRALPDKRQVLLAATRGELPRPAMPLLAPLPRPGRLTVR